MKIDKCGEMLRCTINMELKPIYRRFHEATIIFSDQGRHHSRDAHIRRWSKDAHDGSEL